MTIPLVTLVEGTETVIGEGQTRPVRCIVRFSDLSIRAAVVKRMSPQGVAAEAFCAVLFRGWGLSVPEPALVAGEALAFASLDAGYPNLKQHIGWSDELPQQIKDLLIARGAKLVAAFQQTPLALAADEAIDNRDRNLGNILWDGSNIAWIDHEHSLGLVPYTDQNLLAHLAVMSGDHSKVQTAAVALALTLGIQAVNEATAACTTLSGIEAFAIQVNERIKTLATRVLHRFPQPADLLNEGG
jgi:hypothetical protein